MHFSKWNLSLQDVDKHITRGIPSDHLGRYSDEVLIYIAQKANIQTDGLNTMELLQRIRQEANFILPDAMNWNDEE